MVLLCVILRKTVKLHAAVRMVLFTLYLEISKSTCMICLNVYLFSDCLGLWALNYILFQYFPFQGLPNIDVKIKWPNDLYLNGSKVGGILCTSTYKLKKFNVSAGNKSFLSSNAIQ